MSTLPDSLPYKYAVTYRLEDVRAWFTEVVHTDEPLSYFDVEAWAKARGGILEDYEEVT